MTPFTLIHVGKCGGTSVNHFFNKHRVVFKNVHVMKPQYTPNAKYVLLLRNPVQRFQSAFYWRQHLVSITKEQKHRFPGEYALFQRYATVQDYITEPPPSSAYIHHIHENLTYYLGDLLTRIKPDQILGVICLETIDEDMQRVFPELAAAWQSDSFHSFKNPSTGPKLQVGTVPYQQLKQLLAADYACIDKLHMLGVLTPKQYKLLSA
jgi:hypothetical protein